MKNSFPAYCKHILCSKGKDNLGNKFITLKKKIKLFSTSVMILNNNLVFLDLNAIFSILHFGRYSVPWNMISKKV